MSLNKKAILARLDELRHASAAFTEQIYVNADQARRRAAGRNRSI
jgi:hypothetical protein